MGIGGHVRCRCWEDGKISSPPPFPVHVRMDEEGWLELDLPWSENPEKHDAFKQWLNTCCTHPDMEQASSHISNWSGYRAFQQQMRFMGKHKFPTLNQILPESNGGQAPARAAASALKELDEFCKQDFSMSIDLVVSDTGELVHSYVEDYNGVFCYHPAGHAGVDPEGFFVSHKTEKGEHEVFRSMQFSQQQLGPEQFRITDLSTGHTVETALGTALYGSPDENGKARKSYPAQFEVRQRKLDFTDFLYIVKPLRAVFRASLETGNPVCWC